MVIAINALAENVPLRQVRMDLSLVSRLPSLVSRLSSLVSRLSSLASRLFSRSLSVCPSFSALIRCVHVCGSG